MEKELCLQRESCSLGESKTGRMVENFSVLRSILCFLSRQFRFGTRPKLG